jgi:hypothetical protein
MLSSSVINVSFGLCLLLGSVAAVADAGQYQMYSNYAPIEVPNSNGCPLAGVWSLGSDWPTKIVTGAMSGVQGVKFSAPSNCTAAQFDEISKTILQDFADGTADAPGNNRNLFHAAATYSAVSGPGGLGGVNGGWIRFKENIGFSKNNGLSDKVDYVNGLVKNYPCITFADATIFAGVILTEAAGGPAVAFMPGRKDASSGPINPPMASRLPDGTFTSSGVMYYYTQLGLTDREMAAANGGGHSFGAASPENSGWNGSFTAAGSDFPSPKNLYFVQSFEENWIPQVTKSPVITSIRVQYILTDKQGEPVLDSDGQYIIRIPSDVAILLDGRAPTAWAYSYAQDENLFMTDYGRVLQRLSQVGAGDGWALNQTQYLWLGINGTATNYGTNIDPQVGEPPIPISDIVYPKWIQDLQNGVTTVPTLSLVSGANTTKASSSAFAPIFSVTLAFVMAMTTSCVGIVF